MSDGIDAWTHYRRFGVILPGHQSDIAARLAGGEDEQ